MATRITLTNSETIILLGLLKAEARIYDRIERDLGPENKGEPSARRAEILKLITRLEIVA